MYNTYNRKIYVNDNSDKILPIVKYFNFENYIKNQLVIFINKIYNYLFKFKINIESFICIIYILNSEIAKKMQFYSININEYIKEVINKSVNINSLYNITENIKKVLKSKDTKKRKNKKKKVPDDTLYITKESQNTTNTELLDFYIKQEQNLLKDIFSLDLKESYFYDRHYKTSVKKKYIKELGEYRNNKIHYIKYLYNNNLLTEENVYNKPFFLHLYSLNTIYYDFTDNKGLNETKELLIDIFRKYYKNDDENNCFNSYCINKYNLFITEFNPFTVYKIISENKYDVYIRTDSNGILTKRY